MEHFVGLMMVAGLVTAQTGQAGRPKPKVVATIGARHPRNRVGQGR